jgi:electron transfer flavoprotein alpha/beta subunit
VWAELVNISPPGVLMNSDQWAVEIAVRLMTELRTTGKLTAAHIGQLQKSLASLGMTPADRSKVVVTPKEEEDPWDDL